MIAGDVEFPSHLDRPRFTSFDAPTMTARVFVNSSARVCKRWRNLLSGPPFVSDLNAPLWDDGDLKIINGIDKWLPLTGDTLLNVRIMIQSKDLCARFREHLSRLISFSYDGPLEFAEPLFKANPEDVAVNLVRLAIKPYREGRLASLEADKIVKLPRLKYFSYTGGYPHFLNIHAPLLISLKLPHLDLTEGQLTGLAQNSPLLEEIHAKRLLISSGEQFVLPFEALRALKMVLSPVTNTVGHHLPSLISCPSLETLDLDELSRPDQRGREPLVFSSGSLTTFVYRLAHGGGELFSLHPDIFLSLPNLTSCYFETWDWSPRTRAAMDFNNIVLSGLLTQTGPPSIIPCPRLARLTGKGIYVHPRMLLNILEERSLEDSSPSQCLLTWSWGKHDDTMDFFPATYGENYQEFHVKVREWLQGHWDI